MIILLAIYAADYSSKEKSEISGSQVDVKDHASMDKIDMGRSLNGRVHVSFCQS